MSFETADIHQSVDWRQVLMVQRIGYGRFAMPLGSAMEVDCLVMRYAGIRTALGASAVGEVCMVAVPDENIVDVIEGLVRTADRLFPDELRGVEFRRGGSAEARQPGMSGWDGPWIKLSHCGVSASDGAGRVTHACCPSFVCKRMVPLVDGVLAEHDSTAGGGPCGWGGVGVLDDSADYLPDAQVQPKSRASR